MSPRHPTECLCPLLIGPSVSSTHQRKKWRVYTHELSVMDIREQLPLRIFTIITSSTQTKAMLCLFHIVCLLPRPSQTFNMIKLVMFSSRFCMWSDLYAYSSAVWVVCSSRFSCGAHKEARAASWEPELNSRSCCKRNKSACDRMRETARGSNQKLSTFALLHISNVWVIL